MPIYMDRHDLPETVNAEHVAKIHLEDLRVEHEYGCKGLTYWYDDNRKMAFCLIEAPNEQALQDMHDHAHGGVPNSIIEVDPSLVESFLGRIEDPVKSNEQQLNVIDDPAYRVLMVSGIKTRGVPLNMIRNKEQIHQKYRSRFNDLLETHKGRLVRQDVACSLTSFRSASDAVQCAGAIQNAFDKIFKGRDQFYLKIGLCSGVPVSGNMGLFEEGTKLAERLCHYVDGSIVISAEVRDLYDGENLSGVLNMGKIRSLNPADEKFLQSLLDFVEQSWKRADLKVDDFSRHLGWSKSQLYRKVSAVFGKSLNAFIKEYRLQKSLVLLAKAKGNISEIAFDTGFNSPAYFSKCFYSAFGTRPSELLR